MFDWWYTGKLTRDELRAVIGTVWVMAEWPAAALGKREWVSLFRTAGFIDDAGGPPPTKPMRVYGDQRGDDGEACRGQKTASKRSGSLGAGPA